MSDRRCLAPRDNLVLVGPRCSGKTSLGRALGEQLGRPFVDADERLAERCGRPAEELLATEGEPAFRAVEDSVLRELATLTGHVLATGGGAPLHAAAMAALAASGVVVYLDVPVDELVRRQRERPRTRLRTGALADEVAALHAERDALTRSVAHIVLNPRGPSSILAALDTRPTGPAAR